MATVKKINRDDIINGKAGKRPGKPKGVNRQALPSQ